MMFLICSYNMLSVSLIHVYHRWQTLLKLAFLFFSKYQSNPSVPTPEALYLTIFRKMVANSLRWGKCPVVPGKMCTLLLSVVKPFAE